MRKTRSAADDIQEGDRRARALLLHPAANIERRMKQFSKAESKYREAIDLLLEIEDSVSLVRVCFDLGICLVDSRRSQELAAVRETLLAHLPKIRNGTSLRFQYECLLRELSNESVSSEELRALGEKLGAIARRGCTATRI